MDTKNQRSYATPHNVSELLSRKEAAQYLGVAEHTLEAWASLGRYRLPYVKVGRLAKYRKSDLETFIRDNVVGGTK